MQHGTRKGDCFISNRCPYVRCSISFDSTPPAMFLFGWHRRVSQGVAPGTRNTSSCQHVKAAHTNIRPCEGLPRRQCFAENEHRSSQPSSSHDTNILIDWQVATRRVSNGRNGGRKRRGEERALALIDQHPAATTRLD